MRGIKTAASLNGQFNSDAGKETSTDPMKVAGQRLGYTHPVLKGAPAKPLDKGPVDPSGVSGKLTSKSRP